MLFTGLNSDQMKMAELLSVASVTETPRSLLSHQRITVVAHLSTSMVEEVILFTRGVFTSLTLVTKGCIGRKPKGRVDIIRRNLQLRSLLQGNSGGVFMLYHFYPRFKTAVAVARAGGVGGYFYIIYISYMGMCRPKGYGLELF